MMIMSIICRFFNKLIRLPQSYGFGVQSPSAYSFINNVINEKYLYYAYQKLNYLFPEISDGERRLLQFYFRVVNFSQPSSWIDVCAPSEMMQQYVSEGCHHTQYESNTTLSEIDHFDIVRIKDDNEEIVSHLLDIATHKSILIVEGIYTSKDMSVLWKKLILDNRVRVSYDLLDCGLLFFDNKTKQHYKLFIR
jgi:hypothetical protein